MTIIRSRQLGKQYAGEHQRATGRLTPTIRYGIFTSSENSHTVMMTSDGVNFVPVQRFKLHQAAVDFLLANDVYPKLT